MVDSEKERMKMRKTFNLLLLTFLMLLPIGDVSAAPLIGAGLWSNGDRDASKASIGWLNVWPSSKSSQLTPALAASASNEVHVVDVANGGMLLRDFIWSKTDGW